MYCNSIFQLIMIYELWLNGAVTSFLQDKEKCYDGLMSKFGVTDEFQKKKMN